MMELLKRAFGVLCPKRDGTEAEYVVWCKNCYNDGKPKRVSWHETTDPSHCPVCGSERVRYWNGTRYVNP